MSCAIYPGTHPTVPGIDPTCPPARQRKPGLLHPERARAARASSARLPSARPTTAPELARRARARLVRKTLETPEALPAYDELAPHSRVFRAGAGPPVPPDVRRGARCTATCPKTWPAPACGCTGRADVFRRLLTRWACRLRGHVTAMRQGTRLDGEARRNIVGLETRPLIEKMALEQG